MIRSLASILPFILAVWGMYPQLIRQQWVLCGIDTGT